MDLLIEWIVFLVIYFSSTQWVRALASKNGIRREWALTPCVLSIIFLKSAIVYKIFNIRCPILPGQDSDVVYLGVAILTMMIAIIMIALEFLIDGKKYRKDRDPKEVNGRK